MRTAIMGGLLLLAGCQEGAQSERKQIPDDEPFAYQGTKLVFPKGSVDYRSDRREVSVEYARLMPDAPPSGFVGDARYKIEIGRHSTGKHGPSGYGLGFGFYTDDAIRLDLGDGYEMFCNPEERRMPFFYCAALLRSLPLAAIEYKSRPASAERARAMIDEAEAYLQQAIVD